MLIVKIQILQSKFSRYVKHTLYWFYGFFSYRFVHHNLRPFVFQSVIEFLHSVQAHEVTFIACTSAVLRWCRNKVLIRTFASHLEQYSAFSSYYKIFLVTVNCMFQQSCSRTYLVCQLGYRSLTLRMYQYIGIRILLFKLYNLLYREFFVYMACSVPKKHISSNLCSFQGFCPDRRSLAGRQGSFPLSVWHW